MKGDVKLPVLCTITTLARLGNVSRFTLTQLLRERGVRRMVSGQRILIPMAEIEKKIPLLFQSLQLVASMRRRREEGKRR
jgi:hypothetical protein